MEHIKIWCDASLQLETKKSGYAFIIKWEGFELRCSNTFKKKKPMQPHEAEGMSIGNSLTVLSKLPMLPKIKDVTVYTDCLNIIAHIGKDETMLAKQIKNIVRLLGCQVNFIHIKGHSGIKEIEWCDRNAKKHIKQ